jgi:hypothetical protein
MAEAAVRWNIAEERALLDRNIHAVCEGYHRLEAKSAGELKLDGIWEPAPFPVELPKASRARSNEVAFDKKPWIARSDSLLGDIPEEKSEVLLSRDGQVIPLVPIARAEAQARHDAHHSYCLFCRLAADEFLLLERQTNLNPRNPDPILYNEFGRTAINLYLSIYRGSGHLRAAFWARPDAPGVLRIFTIDWRSDARTSGGWHIHVNDGERTIDYHERPHIAERDVRRPLTDQQEITFCRIAIPAFGDFEVLLERVNACLAVVGRSSESVTLGASTPS